MSQDDSLESNIARLLADPENAQNPLRDALATLWIEYQDHLTQLERLTTISDHYHLAMRERSHTMGERYRKQIRQLNKIVRISDRYQDMQRDLNDALKVASTHDPLTELPNRRLMLERLKAETSLVNRQHKSFTLALIDIDHFKHINDKWGHDAGDAVLIRTSRALKIALRAYDVCARWGGEEFLVLLPETSEELALEISNRLRHMVEATIHPELPPSVCVSISIGVATHRAEDAPDDTIKRADLALYQAKNEGRNRVALAE